ncbi:MULTISPECIES: hypothetical protein [Microbacterium]|uniref:hypothetical protein n=1 Tax=Microbacterium TaxID=33882 RepID=UPI000F8EC0EE|nr:MULTISPECIES: hypothetical protein [Microbacterium]
MNALPRTLSAVILGGVVLAGVLAGCAASAGTSPAPESTSDPDASDASYAPRAAWLDATSFVLKTWGDACAPQIGDLVAGEQSLEIVLVAGPDRACAAVQTARGLYLGLPAGFDSSRPVELTVTEVGGEGDRGRGREGRAHPAGTRNRGDHPGRSDAAADPRGGVDRRA